MLYQSFLLPGTLISPESCDHSGSGAQRFTVVCVLKPMGRCWVAGYEGPHSTLRAGNCPHAAKQLIPSLDVLFGPLFLCSTWYNSRDWPGLSIAMPGSGASAECGSILACLQACHPCMQGCAQCNSEALRKGLATAGVPCPHVPVSACSLLSALDYMFPGENHSSWGKEGRIWYGCYRPCLSSWWLTPTHASPGSTGFR